MVPGSVIHEDEYDYVKGTIGPWSFESPYPYLSEYHSIAKTHIEKCYKYLLSSPTALAAYWMNDSYICVVEPNHFSIYTKKGVFYDKQMRHITTPIQVEHIGYVRTRPKCLAHRIAPYKLFRLPGTDLVLIDGVWKKWELPEDIELNPDLSLYTELLSNMVATSVVRRKNNELLFL